MKYGYNSVAETTPANILLGAGTFHYNLTHNSGSGWSGAILGATSGGGKLTIKPEYKDLDVDGALVKFKGQTVVQGGTATMEVNMTELSEHLLQISGLDAPSNLDPGITSHTAFQPKSRVTEADYLSNFGFIGLTADGRQIVVVFDNALCTSGIEIETKNKEQSVLKLTFEAVADFDGDAGVTGVHSLNQMPVRIYYPKAST